ncbi:hypothetical protein Dimus_027530 [Dionaea muscipula]
MTAASSQLSCFISIHRNNLQSHRPRSVRCLALRYKFTVVMSLEGYNAETHSLNKKANLSYAADLSMSCVEDAAKSYSIADKVPDGNVDVNGPANPSPQKRAAKIHDFCFGIPFGECSRFTNISNNDGLLFMAGYPCYTFCLLMKSICSGPISLGHISCKYFGGRLSANNVDPESGAI